MLPPGWSAGPEHAALELAPEPRQMHGGAPLLPGFGAEMHQLATVSVADWLAVATQVRIDVTARHVDSVLIGSSTCAGVALRTSSLAHPRRLAINSADTARTGRHVCMPMDKDRTKP